MKMKLVAAAACGLLLSGLTLSDLAQAAEVKVLASNALKEAGSELFPQFEKVSANKVAVTWAGTVDIKKRIAAGEVFDLVIVASPEIDAFTKDGKIGYWNHDLWSTSHGTRPRGKAGSSAANSYF